MFDYSRKNKRWRRLRALALRRDGYRCREAARYGRREAAQVVHHIWPAEDYPEYAYCLWNLVSLSSAAHDAMHDRATRKLTALGERWRNRVPPPPGGLRWSLCSWAEDSAHTRRKIFPEKNVGKNAGGAPKKLRDGDCRSGA